MCVQKSMHVTFSFAFYSRYAKTRTFDFPKTVRQHTEGMMRSIINTSHHTMDFVGYLLLFPVVKEF